ncbi:FAD-dependent oxidoreductase [Spirosoma rhododendri]|uniref:FAD-dependent oxidoreductase n=2 Tax=Spirosoma rhododendri TaxID=2728024 RepID=A0A7L5DZ29_9BACT|nr:apoptosis inducing factor family protein [Spirosoma rhododendri]QJD81247.1 FAD-dependent oxidoreductase [Spirosoma rhododendri]
MLTDYMEEAVCGVDDLKDGELKDVRVGDTDVLLARVDGQYYALHPKCTHYQAPLSKGLLNGNRLVCPWHNACFDVRSGHRLEAPALNGLPTHEVRIEGDQVMVRLTTDKESLENPMSTPDPANNTTCVIVGSGGAGAFAAEAMREGGFTGNILMLTSSSQAPYDRPNCSKDYLQGKAPDEWMPLRTPDFYADYGIEIRTGQQVTRLDPQKKEIELSAGEGQPTERITYDKALICSGGKPNKLPVPGADLNGVHVLRSLHDSQQLRDLGQQGKRIVIVGSSFIGLEAAMSLRKLGSEVDVVGMEAIPFEKILGGRVGKVIQGWHEKEGVRFHLGRKVGTIEGTDTVEAVVLDNGDRLPTDAILLGLGVKPNVDFIAGIDREEDGSLRTDKQLQIADGLYVAGDVATYPTADGSQRIEHWKVAGQQGYTAGMNIAGQEMTYQEVPFFWSNQQGKRINYVGHAEKIDDVIYDGNPEQDDNFLAFYVQGGEVKAVAGLKRDTDIIAIRELMQYGQLPAVDKIRKGVDWKAELVTK